MKSLVVFYTRTGTTKKAAEAIAKVLGADIEELSDGKDRKGLFGWLSAGKDASQKTMEKLNGLDHDPAGYDLVIVGTPVWNFTVSSPVRTFLVNYKDRFRKVAFFFTGGGGSSNTGVFPAMVSACEKDSIATLPLRANEVVKGEIAGKINEFVAELR